MIFPILWIRERLEDELHLRHLTVGVLAEALDVRDGELAARSGVTAVVLPALECKCIVDHLRRPSERSQRDVARRLVRGQKGRLEERVLQGGRRRRVGLAEAAALSDRHPALAHNTRGAHGGRVCRLQRCRSRPRSGRSLPQSRQAAPQGSGASFSSVTPSVGSSLTFFWGVWLLPAPRRRRPLVQSARRPAGPRRGRRQGDRRRRPFRR